MSTKDHCHKYEHEHRNSIRKIDVWGKKKLGPSPVISHFIYYQKEEEEEEESHGMNTQQKSHGRRSKEQKDFRTPF